MFIRVCSAGFPVLMIAFLGGYVHSLVPNVLSFTDFVRRRFGPVVQVYVSLLMLFNSTSCTPLLNPLRAHCMLLSAAA